MPDDLVIKFFREDLTETEEQALSDRLTSSEEDALRFGQHAESSYLHYGLPEPQWPGGGPPPGFFPRSGLPIGFWSILALVAGLSVWGFWKWWPGHAVKTPVSLPAVFSPALQPPTGLKEGRVPNPSQQEVAPKPGTVPGSLSKAVPPQNPPSQTGLMPGSTTPIPLDATVSSRHPHTNLEVLVKRAKAGEVTVRVLKPDGTQAVLLYQGMLQPGSWAFDWNGRLSDGEAPAPGTYQIQVLSGAVTLSKNVVIKRQASVTAP
jgi:hypothetical protein